MEDASIEQILPLILGLLDEIETNGNPEDTKSIPQTPRKLLKIVPYL